MGNLRRAVVRSVQVLACALALAGGGYLAHGLRGAEASSVAVGQRVIEPRVEVPAPAPVRVIAEAEPVVPDAAPSVVHRAFGEHAREGMVITGATPHRMILFTFDDGPDLRHTPRLLRQLDQLGIKAVFFLTASRLAGRGPWEVRNQELAREIVRRGHMIGNHTVDHAQLPLLDDAEMIAQVEGADRIFARVLGSRSWLVRPPGGGRSARVDAMLAERGYTQVLWNLGSGDFQVRDADEVLRIWRRVLARRERENGERGGIVLLHDTHEWSVDAFPRMVSYLRERNCELLERGEELYDIVGDPALFHVARDPENPGAIAPPATPAILAERQRTLRDETRQRCERLAQR